MRRFLAIILVLLLLCGCTRRPETDQTESQATSQTEAQTTAQTEAQTEASSEAAALESARLSDLTADTVLLYRQAGFKSRQGDLLSMETVLSAPEEALLPRTHYYDDCFPGGAACWLRLLDYAFANEYQGFSVRTSSLPVLTADQRSMLGILYHIDDGKPILMEVDGVSTVWYHCNRADTMEKFTVGLAEARRIAAEAPRGDDWETAAWIFNYLADHVDYGDRETYYRDRGHHLCDTLLDHEGLCSGYADAMYYLCNLCGVECLELQGLSNGPAGPGSGEAVGHAWNCVRVYGTWYVCDPTFNDTAPVPADVPLCFCLSSRFFETTFGHSATEIYGDPEKIPACEKCFDPVSAWNTTPEGALKSWLWFAACEAFDPVYLLAGAGLTDYRADAGDSDEETRITDVPYADFAAWSGRFMSRDAMDCLSDLFFEGEDGRLHVRRKETETGIDWAKLQLVSVTETDGVYTADLGDGSAAFTVSQSGDGLYRIETIALAPKE